MQSTRTRARCTPHTPQQDGFIHLTKDPQLLLGVANMFYKGVADAFLVLVIDSSRLSSKVRGHEPSRVLVCCLGCAAPLNAGAAATATAAAGGAGAGSAGRQHAAVGADSDSAVPAPGERQRVLLGRSPACACCRARAASAHHPSIRTRATCIAALHDCRIAPSSTARSILAP